MRGIIWTAPERSKVHIFKEHLITSEFRLQIVGNDNEADVVPLITSPHSKIWYKWSQNVNITQNLLWYCLLIDLLQNIAAENEEFQKNSTQWTEMNSGCSKAKLYSFALLDCTIRYIEWKFDQQSWFEIRIGWYQWKSSWC